MQRIQLVCLTTLLFVAPVMRAQTSVPPDSRVRVTLRDERRVTGKLSDVRGDTLVVIGDGLLFHPTWRVPGDQTKSVEVSRGKYRSAGRVVAGGLLGAGLAFLATRTIPGLVDDECSADVCSSPSVAGPVFVGFLGGGVLGAFSRGDRWESVPRPVRVGFGGEPDGARLGIAFAF